jgi:transposase
MNKQTRGKFTPELEAKVALEALKEQSTLSEIAKKFEISPVKLPL